MAVLRDHAVADDLRALRQVVGQNDQHGLADRARGDVARLAGGIDDADHGRRDALVEVQLHHLRRLVPARCHRPAPTKPASHGPTRRSRCKEPTAARQGRRARAPSGSLYGFAISLRPGAGVLLSCAMAAPSAGISIQRLTPCSHSCTTGKYSVVSGFRPAGEKAGEDEFIEIVVGELAAAPHHFLDAFGQFAAVKLILGGVFALDRLEGPARLRHRLDADHAFRNLHPQLDGRRSRAAMRHGEHRLVVRADRRLPLLEGDMRGCRSGRERGKGDDGKSNLSTSARLYFFMSGMIVTPPGACAPTPCTSSDTVDLAGFFEFAASPAPCRPA